MKFCTVVPEICRGQVHASRKERIRIIMIKIKIIIRNEAKTISLPNKIKVCAFNQLKLLVQIFSENKNVTDHVRMYNNIHEPLYEIISHGKKYAF